MQLLHDGIDFEHRYSNGDGKTPAGLEESTDISELIVCSCRSDGIVVKKEGVP